MKLSSPSFIINLTTTNFCTGKKKTLIEAQISTPPHSSVIKKKKKSNTDQLITNSKVKIKREAFKFIIELSKASYFALIVSHNTTFVKNKN